MFWLRNKKNNIWYALLTKGLGPCVDLTLSLNNTRLELHVFDMVYTLDWLLKHSKQAVLWHSGYIEYQHSY